VRGDAHHVHPPGLKLDEEQDEEVFSLIVSTVKKSVARIAA
jgi:hypothetical protein